MKNETNKYQYPLGDFLSGFSEDPSNPCDYELECQRMVSRGVEYLDQNPDFFSLVENGIIKSWHSKQAKPMIEFMCHPDSGQTGAMVSHCFNHAYHAKLMGWDEYVQIMTSKDIDK
jgi:hypothetical protein